MMKSYPTVTVMNNNQMKKQMNKINKFIKKQTIKLIKINLQLIFIIILIQEWVQMKKKKIKMMKWKQDKAINKKNQKIKKLLFKLVSIIHYYKL